MTYDRIDCNIPMSFSRDAGFVLSDATMSHTFEMEIVEDSNRTQPDLNARKKACMRISQKVYLEPKWLRYSRKPEDTSDKIGHPTESRPIALPFQHEFARRKPTNLRLARRLPVSDTVSEWLRRWTRNPLGFARRGSNPLGVGFRSALCGSNVPRFSPNPSGTKTLNPKLPLLLGEAAPRARKPRNVACPPRHVLTCTQPTVRLLTVNTPPRLHDDISIPPRALRSFALLRGVRTPAGKAQWISSPPP
jgi:hypothetical protein